MLPLDARGGSYDMKANECKVFPTRDEVSQIKENVCKNDSVQ